MGKNPTDRGKSGTKRSVLTDGGGVPIGLAVEGANRNDFKMVEATLTSIPIERPTPTPAQPQGMCLDKRHADWLYTPQDENGTIAPTILPVARRRATRMGRESAGRYGHTGTHFFAGR